MQKREETNRKYAPKNLQEFYALIVDLTRGWKHCEHRACLRARRCVAAPPPCFERHADVFREFMRERVAPQLRGEIALPKLEVDNSGRASKRSAADA